MEDEMNNFIKVWLSILVSLSYCYGISNVVPKGVKRLFCFLPIVCLFLLLPFNLTSVNLGGFTAFFISWLANFKLLLFAFGKGPLASNSSISIGRFMVISYFPIEIRDQLYYSKTKDPLVLGPKLHPTDQNPSSHHENDTQDHYKETPSEGPKSHSLLVSKRPPINFPMKAMLLAIVIRVLGNKKHMHEKVNLVLYCLFLYLLLETVLATLAALVRAMMGVELEPHFNEPYLSNSLQDFWSKRWNLMVSRTLHLAVYKPALGFTSSLIGRKWAPLPAVMVTFFVSGLAHELIYYYVARVPPTWEVTWFFILHGSCLTVEIFFKKALTNTWRLPRLISGPLIVVFVMLTSFWLFLPQFQRCKADVKMLQEYVALGDLLRNISQWLVVTIFQLIQRPGFSN